MKAETIIGPASIVEKPERPYLGIRFETPFSGMFALATKALKELRKWSKANSCLIKARTFYAIIIAT